jgi:hypothetical protein
MTIRSPTVEYFLYDFGRRLNAEFAKGVFKISLHYLPLLIPVKAIFQVLHQAFPLMNFKQHHRCGQEICPKNIKN